MNTTGVGVVIDTNVFITIIGRKSSSRWIFDRIIFNWRLISEDPDDNKFIDCYLASGAEYLVSNDQHFIKIKQIDFPRINLYSLNEFERNYEIPQNP